MVQPKFVAMPELIEDHVDPPSVERKNPWLRSATNQCPLDPKSMKVGCENGVLTGSQLRDPGVPAAPLPEPPPHDTTNDNAKNTIIRRRLTGLTSKPPKGA